MSSVKIDLPENLRKQLRDMVTSGWFSTEDQAIQEALRRFLEARTLELMERHIRRDIAWGLKGDE